MLPSMASMGNNPDQSTLKNLLNQILLSGMSIPQEDQSIDYQRLQEELFRSTRHDNMRGVVRNEREDPSYRAENPRIPTREWGDQGDRRQYNLTQQRVSQSDSSFKRSEEFGQNRANFFGGALERKDLSKTGQESWWQPGDLDSERQLREWERRGEMRDGNNRTTEQQDTMGGGIDGNSFFNASYNLQLPNAVNPSMESYQDMMPSTSVGPEMWPSSNDTVGYMHGMDTNFMAADPGLVRPAVSLEPPPPHQQQPTRSEKPEGCHTVFIGGLPDTVTENIIREVFYMCGAIESIRISAGKGGKRFCHLRFIDAESVDFALQFAGYKLFIGSLEDRTGGRMHVDYAKSREDQKEYEKLLRAKAREVRHQEKIEERVIVYTWRSAEELLQSIRSDSSSLDSLQTLAQWLERGECNRQSATIFYNLLNAVHSHIRRLLKAKKEHEEIVETQKQEQFERAKVIMGQGAAILDVYKSASKRKCWDHFSKAQRKNIGIWHQQVEKEIKISTEEQMENRVEVGMDIDDETDRNQSTSEHSQPEEDNTGEPQAKHIKLQGGSVEDKAALDIKYRAQNASLKALAEKNTSLMWQVEGYKNEVFVLKKRFANVFQDKDLQIARLMTAVQGLQNFFQHVTINTNEQKTANIEVEVETESSTVLPGSSAQKTTGESTSASHEDEAESLEKPNDKQTEKEEDRTEDSCDASALIDNAAEEQTGEPSAELKAVEVQSTDISSDKNEGTEKESEKEASVDAAMETAEKELLPEPTTVSEKVENNDADANKSSAKAPIAEKLGDESVAGHEESTPTHDACSQGVVRLSSKEMVVVGLLCSYLQICPYGATTQQVIAHVQRQVPGVTVLELEKILNGLPMLFLGDGLEFLVKTWKFKH